MIFGITFNYNNHISTWVHIFVIDIYICPSFCKNLRSLSRTSPVIINISKTVVWLEFNLTTSQKGPYYTGMNRYSFVWLLNRLWDANEWYCVLYGYRTHFSSRFSCKIFHYRSTLSHQYSLNLTLWVLWFFPKQKYFIELFFFRNEWERVTTAGGNPERSLG